MRRPVVGYEDLYEVSDTGEVFRKAGTPKCKHGRRLHCSPDGNGYIQVALCRGGIRKPTRVHVLVAEAFLENAGELPEVNHINGNKSDNRVENLEWSTRGANLSHSVNVLGNPKPPAKFGAQNPKSKINPLIAQQIRTAYSQGGVSLRELGKRFGLGTSSIHDIVRGETWKELPPA